MTDPVNLANIKNNYPIVIVGGGLVGATLAIALKNIGIDSLVVEAFAKDSSEQPSFDQRTVALSMASLQILEELELSQDLISNSETIKNIHVSDQGHYGFCRLESEKLGVKQLGAVIENQRLGDILLSKINQELIDYLAPAKVVDVGLTGTSNQVLIEVAGEQKKIETQLVILAEGARSSLKDGLNFASEVTEFSASAIVCNVKPQLAHENWAYERFTENGPLALLPLSQNRLSIVWSLSKEKCEELLEVSENKFGRALEKAFGARLGKIEKVGKRVAFPLTQLVSINSVRQGCLLLGNSAQALHPIAGQGLNLAIRDIAALCALFKEKLEQNPNLNFGDYQLLARFQEARKQDREQTLFATESLARLFANSWQPLSISRNLLMKALDVAPIAKQEFARMAMGYRS